MKVLVCGSRDWTNSMAVARTVEALDSEHGADLLILHGAARGVDRFAAEAAWELDVPTKAFPPDYKRWSAHVAPLKRNLAMLDEEPDLVIAFQRNGSRGTQHTIDEAHRRGIPVEVHEDRPSPTIHAGAEDA